MRISCGWCCRAEASANLFADLVMSTGVWSPGEFTGRVSKTLPRRAMNCGDEETCPTSDYVCCSNELVSQPLSYESESLEAGGRMLSIWFRLPSRLVVMIPFRHCHALSQGETLELGWSSNWGRESCRVCGLERDHVSSLKGVL